MLINKYGKGEILDGEVEIKGKANSGYYGIMELWVGLWLERDIIIILKKKKKKNNLYARGQPLGHP
jgi:hypothetical protein